jgi:hypothetical protein
MKDTRWQEWQMGASRTKSEQIAKGLLQHLKMDIAQG